jgi:hypothetical protein
MRAWFTSREKPMRRLCLCLILLLVGAVSTQAQQRTDGAASDLTGTWSGTWEGAGSAGGFELTLEKGKDGSPTGRVSVTGEPAYKATIRTLTFEGKKMTATYDFPPDDSMEVVLTVTFDGDNAKGPWSARQKAGGEIANGTFTLNRK